MNHLCEISRNTATTELLRVWGHSEFRPGQWEVVSAILAGRDVVGVLPTGTGKSVCYQLPALLLPGTTVVISPLIALMKDQVSNLQARGIPATAFNSSSQAGERDRLYSEAAASRFKFVYASPELLQTARFADLLKRLAVSFVVVDEAHCIGEWGYHFRPSFRRIADAVPHGVPRVAVTATATRSAQRDIIRILRLRKPAVVVTGYDRPNLYWSASKVHSATLHVSRLLALHFGAAVVYCMTRRSVEWWAKWLSKRGVPASFYHGGLNRQDRSRAQTDWLCDRTRVMVATNAFGMGIDKPDVRLVAHVGLPSNISSYYQEAGRAGRDGERAAAALIYMPSDVGIRARLLENPAHAGSRLARRQRRIGKHQFGELLRYLRSPLCRRRYLLNYFGEAFGENCGRCDRCDEYRKRYDLNDVAERSRSIDIAAQDRPVTPEDSAAWNRLVKDEQIRYSDDLSKIELVNFDSSQRVR